jgi:hypothetical protein
MKLPILFTIPVAFVFILLAHGASSPSSRHRPCGHLP